MWHFEFEAPVGTRILSSRFMGITHYEENLWWSYDYKKWTTLEECMKSKDGASNTVPCRSFKAFKKHLKNHPELKVVDEVILVSRFIGHCIKAKWIE